jgi:hypothetical protein
MQARSNPTRHPSGLSEEQRRWFRIQQVHATLAIEGSTLTLEQVAALHDQMKAEAASGTTSERPRDIAADATEWR